MEAAKSIRGPFDLSDRVVLITGGAGLLGVQHAKAVSAFGGIPVIADIDDTAVELAMKEVGGTAFGVYLDVTDPHSVLSTRTLLEEKYGAVDVLINNAARNPKVEKGKGGAKLGRIEDTDLASWELDIRVGLTGAMLCSRYFGEAMAKRKSGVILNIASDLALIAPDQRLYRKEETPESEQPKKPLAYSVVKSGLVGMTKYFATYWADRGVRCNALCPGGVENGQDPEFLGRISKLIPLGRMAQVSEYQGAVVFLCSDASTYMNGAVIAMDGGRSCW